MTYRLADMVKRPFHGGGRLELMNPERLREDDQLFEVADVWELSDGNQRVVFEPLYQFATDTMPFPRWLIQQDSNTREVWFFPHDAPLPGQGPVFRMVGADRLSNNKVWVYGRKITVGDYPVNSNNHDNSNSDQEAATA